MKNWNIIAGAVCSVIVLGVMIILSVYGAWGEKKGITPGLTDPGAKSGRNNTAPSSSTAKSDRPIISGIGEFQVHPYRYSESKPVIRPGQNIDYYLPVIEPDPNIDYKKMVMKPDTNIDYKIQVIRPNPNMISNVYTLPPKPVHPGK